MFLGQILTHPPLSLVSIRINAIRVAKVHKIVHRGATAGRNFEDFGCTSCRDDSICRRHGGDDVFYDALCEAISYSLNSYKKSEMA